MALVSPGIQISINDQSQYVNANVGSIPLVLLATAQDKTYNGASASGTTKVNAGKLLSFSSQRDLVTRMGTPTFDISATGTPINGSEINEYGLLAAYSALGLGNQLFAIRADVDLAQLVGTSVRPVGLPLDGTYWLDTVNTEFGIYVSNTTTGTFSHVSPTIIADSSKIFNDSGFAYAVPTPVSSFGRIGDYALVMVNTDGTTASPIRLFYKAGSQSAAGAGLSNTWVQVGSDEWQKSTPSVTGTVANPTWVNGTTYTATINGTAFTYIANAGTPAEFAAAINTLAVAGVFAGVYTVGANSYIQIFVTSDANNGAGSGSITNGTNTPFTVCGISTVVGSPTTVPQQKQGIYYAAILGYGDYTYVPTNGWFNVPADINQKGRPSGSIWWKTTSTGVGFSPVLKRYNSTLGTFQSVTAPLYSNYGYALYALDPSGGGANIAAGQVISHYNVSDATANALRFSVQAAKNITTATGALTTEIIDDDLPTGDQVTIRYSTPGIDTLSDITITLSGDTSADFVTDILAAEIPYVTATLNSNKTITLTHTSGGLITLTDVSTDTVRNAIGFDDPALGSGFTVSVLDVTSISNFTNITALVNYQASTPYTSPESGTYWYYSNSSDIDIMINNGTGAGWKGYRNVSYDSRGYVLTNTDENGVIISPVTPTSQSSGDSLVAGDLWLDNSDLENYPALYRYNGSEFTAIDKTDHTSAAGIIFADARWDTDGTTDIITGELPPVADLLTSNYLDLDAPDYRLYPRGILMFNTRRSGYNVKKYVPDYYNSTTFPNVGANTIGLPTALPSVRDAWLTASGLDANGAMKAGSKSQRAVVVSALESAIDSNLDVLEQIYNFNLMCVPGYPELIPNLITLNDNRGSTAFIIGDTPLTLQPNSVAITNWVNNVGGNGLPSDASASAYLGIYYPSGLTNDLAGNQVVVPASHAVLRTFLYNDQVANPWFAPAGTNRGLINNLSDIGYINSATGLFVHNSINQGMRDALYLSAINPMTQLPNVGLVVWGQLTRSGSSTARNRVNVVRLENYLRRVFSTVANGYLFEPNDQVTRKSIARQIESSLNDIQSKRGVYDFLVICDSSNNTSATIANNQLYVDVAIEPMRDVEFIFIPIAIYNPGAIAALNTTST
jgi:hypothetical protein